MTLVLEAWMRRWGSTMPICDEGQIGMLEHLAYCRTLPPHIALHACRFTVRTAGALLPALDGDPDRLLTVCGMNWLPAYLGEMMIRCEGPWTGETSPQGLRCLLADVDRGIRPEDSATIHRISADELWALEGHLRLRQHWTDRWLDRVLDARQAGGSWASIARVLGTTRPREVNAWIQMAKRVERELGQKAT